MKPFDVIQHVQAWKVVPGCKLIEKFDNDDQDHLDQVFRLWKQQVRFFTFYAMGVNRNSVNSLPKVLSMLASKEGSHTGVRLKIGSILGSVEFWTIYGKLEEMAILKPKDKNDFMDLTKWSLVMMFPKHQTRMIILSVADAIGRFDHVMAWYAFMRKFPVEYEIWNWAGNIYSHHDIKNPEVLASLGLSEEYKLYWSYVHEQEGSGYPMMNNQLEWTDDLKCPWE